MKIKKILKIVLVVFAVFYVLRSPNSAAGTLRAAGTTASEGAQHFLDSAADHFNDWLTR